MTVNAQSGKGSFAGRVVDKDTKQPVGYAAVRKGGETMRVKVRSV
jgi:hypothetical protein